MFLSEVPAEDVEPVVASAVMEDADTLQTMVGLDGARRVAWAKFYEKARELEAMSKAAHSMLTQAVAFAQEIRKSEYLANDDRLVKLAEEFLRRVALTPNGAKMVERVKGFEEGS